MKISEVKPRPLLSGGAAYPRHFCRWAFLVLLAAGIVVVVPAARLAAGNRFADHRLVDALAERGMTDLLEHLVASEASSDVAESLELVYRIHLSRWEDTSTDQAVRVDQLKVGIEKIRELISRFPDHESRPIWQTDLGGLLLFQTLNNAEGGHAGHFYEFGVPTEIQKEIFEASTVEAIQVLFAAAHRLFVLQGELPKQADHTVKRVNTGKWSWLIGKYAKLRTPFYTGLACLYAAMLPDDHPFYANLEKPDPKMPRRGRTVEAERRRLLAKGVVVLEEIVEDTRDSHGVRGAALSVTARLQLALAQGDAALASLQEAEALVAPGSVAHLVLLGARARAHHVADRQEEALAIVKTLRQGALAGRDLFALLLITDLKHRFLLNAAGQAAEARQAEALAGAYGVYDELFNDPRITARAEDVRLYVYRRWAAEVGDATDLSQLPSMMLRAAGKLSIDQAESLHGQAAEAGPDEKEAFRARAVDRYRRAIKIYTVLRGRSGLTDADWAEAGYNMALATYRQDETSDSHALDAVRGWLELAQTLPEEQISGVAISHAADLIGVLRGRNPDDQEIGDLYTRVVVETLLESYPLAPGGNRRRAYHAEDVLMPAGRYDEAVAMLRAVLADGEGPAIYFAAQTNLLICLQQAQDASPAEDRASNMAALRNEVKRVASEAEAALAHPDPRVQVSVATALANALMVESKILLDEGKAAAAAERLRSIESVQVPDNVRNVARSHLIAALAQLGELVKAREEAERLMETAPDDASGVIYDVVTEMGRKVGQMRREALMPQTTEARRRELREQSRSMSSGAVRLATLLVDWAQSQPDFTKIDIAAVQLVSARAKSLAGMTGEAIAELEEVRKLEEFANDLGLLDAMGEAHFQAGSPLSTGDDVPNDVQRKSLIEAAGYYDIILGGVEPDETGTFPDLWWNAWMRRLQVNDILDEGAKEIQLRVRQLRLTDPDLGGQPYKSELGRLENKHRLR